MLAMPRWWSRKAQVSPASPAPTIAIRGWYDDPDRAGGPAVRAGTEGRPASPAAATPPRNARRVSVRIAIPRGYGSTA